MTDVVLIHSTGQSAAGWDRLIAALEARGVRGHAVDLPNDRPELRADDYARVLADRYGDLDRPIVLAHSGSGPLLPAAATALGARRQVWLAAWVPHPSLSFFDDARAHKEEAFEPGWIGRDPTVDDEAAIHFVYHDCDAETQAWALTTRRPFLPEAVYNEPVALEPAIPSTYIVALEDRTIRPAWQRRMALERLGIPPVELAGGHCPNVSRPADLAELLTRLDSTTYWSPRPNVVEGDNGVSVEVLGRTGIRYGERGRSCFVDSEVLAVPAIAVWPSGIRRWDPPHEDEPLTDDDRRRILQNIADAFASQDWGLELIDRGGSA